MRGQADRAVARGDAVRILPGVVAAASLARDPQTIIRALFLWHRDVVLVGKAALILLGMRAPGSARPMDLRSVAEVEAFSRTRSLVRPAIQVHRWHVPHRFITERERVRLATPEVSVLMLAVQGEWEWVCEALRQRIVTPGSCRKARRGLTGRFPKVQVDAALADITLAAWSIPELEMGRMLRAVGITGHKPNHKVQVGDRYFYLDQAFEEEKVALEIDGRKMHGTADGYEATMMRSAHLDRHGWKVLHTTPTMIRRNPQFVLDWLASHLHRRHRPKAMFSEPVLRSIMMGLGTA
ncbi:endonuclease domain-containing protein [Cutibacterium sp. V970]|uniref:endonuclease domain-containing protein n=1 Tax=Cutibacterium sp. V970 TaxID=3446481 RepID=UPI003EDF8C03